LLRVRARTGRELIALALSEGYQLTRDAVELLERVENPHEVLRKAIEERRKARRPTTMVIDAPTISKLINVEAEKQKETTTEIKEEELPRKQYKADYKIIHSIPEDYKISGTMDEFMQYFKSKYHKLRRIIERRGNNYVPIVELTKLRSGEEAYFIGMVMDKRETEKAIILTCDDLSGYVNVIVPKRDRELTEVAEEILIDQVIGVRARKRETTFIASEIQLPEIENNRITDNGKGDEVYACLISDIHIGSRKFREDLLEKFLDWINRGKDRVAKRLKYLIINGDLVDGIGVYPGQEKELEIVNVEEQFRKASKYLAEIPEEVEVIFCPGNHEPIRKALPQPPVGGKYRSILTKARPITFGTNPSTIIMENRKLIIYHGQGLEEVIEFSKNLSYSVIDRKIGDAMVKLIRFRHLAPCYGGSTQIMPLGDDPLVIEETPDILHTGHIHTAAAVSYRGVHLINSGTWQDQTQYQKRLGINPTVGTAAIIELSKMQVSIRKFT